LLSLRSLEFEFEGPRAAPSDAGVRRPATGCPWKPFAAPIEINPHNATAVAIIQRLMREISAKPASRAPSARVTIVPGVFGSGATRR
jgi:hypothetical protein